MGKAVAGRPGTRRQARRRAGMARGRGWWGKGRSEGGGGGGGGARRRCCSALPWCCRRCSGCPRSRGGAGWRGRTGGVEVSVISFDYISESNWTMQSTLQLTPSLFGNSSFEILRFPGVITIIPPQNAFVAPKPDALFNFSLNFSIDVEQNKLSELKAQMKSGLFLSQLEILYVTLTNLDGSTIAPPTIVQTSVLLAVGADRKQPSLQ